MSIERNPRFGILFQEAWPKCVSRSNAKYPCAINFTNIPKSHKLPSSLRDLGNFVRTLGMRVMIVLIILGSSQVHTITYTTY